MRNNQFKTAANSSTAMNTFSFFFTLLLVTTLFCNTTQAAEAIAATPKFEDVSICRLQLKVKTNGKENADTDNPVWVQMNSRDQPYFLNLSKNDREKNRTDVYDILSPNINKIKDIQYIRVGLKGNDGWNIREMSLIVNGRTVYSINYSTAGLWLDGDNSKYKSSVSIPRSIIRQHAKFRYTSNSQHIWKAPAIIPSNMILDMVESAVGNSLSQVKKVTWGQKNGADYINFKRINENTLRFDLDLSYDVTGPNPEIDVDFDIVFTCNNGTIQTQIKNMKTEVSGIYTWINSTIKKLRGVFLAKCTAINPAGAIICDYGLNKLNELLNFNYEYDGLSGVSYPKSCSGDMRLDASGNLEIYPNGQKTSAYSKPKLNPNIFIQMKQN